MPKRRTVDDDLAALDELPAEPAARAAELTAALASKHHRVLAKAAQACAEGLHYDLVPALQAAFVRLLDEPAKRDPSCHAKSALLRALVGLDCADVDVYRQGLRYRQLEPVWGGTTDTAFDVRCQSAMGLVASGHSRALVEVTPLLADAEAPVRCGAIRAIACGNPHDAELVLCAKLACGDAAAEVVGECFTALLGVAPEDSIELVARYLDDRDDAVRELAALALGESRLAAALAPLQAAWGGVLVSASFKRALLRAAAAHRSEPAHEWVLSLAATERSAVVVDIIDVLAVYKHNAKLARRLRETLNARGDAALLVAFEERWR